MRKYVAIATKVPPVYKERLKAIAEQHGLNTYEMIQGLVFAVLRLHDQPGEPSDEEAEMLLQFRGDKRWQTSRAHKVTTAVVFDDQQIPALVRYTEDDKVKSTYNIDAIIAAMLNAVDPGLLKLLKRARTDNGWLSLAYTLRRVIRKGSTPQDISDEIATMFQNQEAMVDGCRVDTTTYKRKHNRGEYTTPYTPKTQFVFNA